MSDNSNTMEAVSTHPMSALYEKLTNPDLQSLIRTVRDLPRFARALGVECTRMELVPLLAEIDFNYEEVFMEVANQLGNFIDYVGGPTYAYVLLEPLESLATRIESENVRDKTVESLCKVADSLPLEHLELHFYSLIVRLTSSQSSTSRSAACGLFSACYSRFDPETKCEIFGHFRFLCQDGNPRVRQNIAIRFGRLARTVELDTLKRIFLPWILRLTEDVVDYVRLDAVVACADVLPLLTEDDIVNLMMPTLRKRTTDRSPLVRTEFIDDFAEYLYHTPADARTDIRPLPSHTDVMDLLLPDPRESDDDEYFPNIHGDFYAIMYNSVINFEMVNSLIRVDEDALEAIRRAGNSLVRLDEDAIVVRGRTENLLGPTAENLPIEGPEVDDTMDERLYGTTGFQIFLLIVLIVMIFDILNMANFQETVKPVKMNRYLKLVN